MQCWLPLLTDHFSKFVQVYPTTNKSAKTAADRLYNDFMLRYGLPRKNFPGRPYLSMKSLYNRSPAVFADLFVVGYTWTNFEKWSVNSGSHYCMSRDERNQITQNHLLLPSDQ